MKWKLALVLAAVLPLAGCFDTMAYDPATVANLKKVKDWQDVERKKVGEALTRLNGTDQDKQSFTVRHDALAALLDTAIKAEEAKKPKEAP